MNYGILAAALILMYTGYKFAGLRGVVLVAVATGLFYLYGLPYLKKTFPEYDRYNKRF